MALDAFLLYVLTRVWLLERLTNLVAIFSGIIATFCFLGAFFCWTDAGKVTDYVKACLNAGKKTLWIFIPFLTLNYMLPDKKDTMFILAGTGVLAAVKSEAAASIASKSVQIIEQFLDNQLKEGKEKK